MTPFLPNDIRELSLSDRIELATAIWESVAEDARQVELSEAQRQELDRRLTAREAAPNAGASWGEVKARLLAKQ